MSLLFVILAACCNAVMDILENENFHQSVFRTWNQKFWYKRESWKYAKKIFNYKIDGWHLAKSAMIINIATALVLAVTRPSWIERIVILCILGIAWICTFDMIYFLLKTTNNEKDSRSHFVFSFNLRSIFPGIA